MAFQIVWSQTAVEDLREIVRFIIYQVDERREVIYILRIWHAARGVPDLE